MKYKIKCKSCGEILEGIVPIKEVWCSCGNVGLYNDYIAFGKVNNLPAKYCYEDLINTHIKSYNKIFSYKYFASNNFLGANSDGFEVLLFDCIDSFNLVYRELDFDNNVLDVKKYLLSKECINNIIEILNNNSQIFQIPNNLNNGSCDGSGNEFYFSNGNLDNNILAWNIDISDISDKDLTEDYLNEYSKNLLNEKFVLKVFKLITKELKKHNIILSLFKFSTKISEYVEIDNIHNRKLSNEPIVINVYKSETASFVKKKVIGKYKFIADEGNIDLVKGKIYYRVEPESEFRIVNDSGEDYLYIPDDFEKIE